MHKRDLLRYIPPFSGLVKALDAAEGLNRELDAENRKLRRTLQQLIFGDERSFREFASPDQPGVNGLPVPSDILRFLVAGTDDLHWFLESGILGAQTLQDALARQGKTINQFKRVLDFGCGCGRILRHLQDLPEVELHGTDCNTWAIRWCQRFLAFAKFGTNSLEPPLAYSGDMFELIYAFSIFTHLTEPLQARWMEELRRVLVPEGYLILSVCGDKCTESLTPANRLEYRKGNMVIVADEDLGLNYCGVYHPERYVRRVLAKGFEVVDSIPEGAKGNPPQDLYVMRKS